MKIIFTKHAENRLKKRKITQGEVEEAIMYSKKSEKKGNKHRLIKNIGRGNIEIIYERDKYIKVITVYWI